MATHSASYTEARPRPLGPEIFIAVQLLWVKRVQAKVATMKSTAISIFSMDLTLLLTVKSVREIPQVSHSHIDY